VRAVVIGGGFGGLATAAFLAKKGFDVVLVEKGCRLGGRSALVELGATGLR
jgi:phytoene dehydrogenase-like protein